MANKLTDSFLSELFKLAFLKQHVLDSIVKHLKYEYIPVELKNYKKILKSINNIYKVSGKLPTYGAVSQQHNTDFEVQELIEEIKETNVADTEIIFDQLEEYIKSIRFQLMNEQIFDLYKEGRKEEAIKLSADESQEISNFSIRDGSGKYLRLFKDFTDQQKSRSIEDYDEIFERVPFGVDSLDDLTNGGIDLTDIALYIARSGVGKSTWLKWSGFYAVRLNYDVLHIQLEGSEQEAYDKYSQVWTGLKYPKIRNGDLSSKELEQFEKEARMMNNKGKELTIYSFEKFDEVSMVDIRDIVLEYEQINGKVPDMVVIDSLDLVHPGDGIRYGVDTQSIKMKLQNSAKKMKNLAVELKTRILTATQTGDVSPQVWNDPDKVITRNNTEGDKTLVKPFSYVFTLNQTDDERKMKEARIYVDKLRNYSPGKSVFKICTHYENGRFYDKARTLKKYHSDDKG